ncbi:hypothetical protein MYX06_04710 [Patescibacteria group bacterium AH-259-L05]|nr:hypothetical protein [Patescibacteria group bacterium AH-259-L05]
MATELKKPEEWQKEFDFTVVDPDGWMSQRIPWDEPISREKFEELAMASTIKLKKKN